MTDRPVATVDSPPASPGRRPFPIGFAWGTLLSHERRIHVAAISLLLATGLLIVPSGIGARPVLIGPGVRWTEGRITGKLGEPQFSVKYEFRDESGTLREERSVLSRSDWTSAESGDPIDVRYLASNPRVTAAFKGYYAYGENLSRWMGVVSVVLGVVAGCLIVAGMRRTAEKIRLLRDGERAMGRVVVVRRKGKDRSRVTSIDYAFSAPLPHAERPLTFRGRFDIPFGGSPQLRAGDTVEVAYDPIEPEVSTVAWHELGDRRT